MPNIQLIVVRALASSIWTSGNHVPGDVVWVRTEEAARHLIEGGFCKLPTGRDGQAGAKETKPAEVPETKKSFGEATIIPSTASPESSEPGKTKLWYASAEALVSPQRM